MTSTRKLQRSFRDSFLAETVICKSTYSKAVRGIKTACSYKLRLITAVTIKQVSIRSLITGTEQKPSLFGYNII